VLGRGGRTVLSALYSYCSIVYYYIILYCRELYCTMIGVLAGSAGQVLLYCIILCSLRCIILCNSRGIGTGTVLFKCSPSMLYNIVERIYPFGSLCNIMKPHTQERFPIAQYCTRIVQYDLLHNIIQH
jgi:hypothetical protein